MGFVQELKTGNFSLYGQLLGLLSGVLMIVLGGVTILSHVIYSVLAIVFGALCLFIELPIFLRLCPTGPKFDKAVRGLRSHWLRFFTYLIFAIVMWASLASSVTLLAIAAVAISLTALCYLVAALRNQVQVTTALLGGSGAAGHAAYDSRYAQPV
ncbi:Golgi apparatus membrane protein tvp18 [Coemansia biformis]|uniref:Golgi apparatus membrane protein tvp18 n=1 Tax=Coemansia biformis TaxID=1286918 RepID=A0A9W8CPU6_9FUNG|nr:Golgi apparatus membrane protein tvp18 [Coemansia biformis]